jgi:hypothetical protein
MNVLCTVLPRTSRSIAFVLLLAAAGGPVHAASADPLQSVDCRRAVASLQAEEATAMTRHASDPSAASEPATPSPSLQDARRNAATRCLASRADPEPPRGRLAQPPIVVDPVAPLTTARMPAPSIAHGPAPAPAPRRGDAVVSCDPGGCWANDGSRLQRVGPNLWGPRGVCTLQGASLQCP